MFKHIKICYSMFYSCLNIVESDKLAISNIMNVRISDVFTNMRTEILFLIYIYLDHSYCIFLVKNFKPALK